MQSQRIDKERMEKLADRVAEKAMKNEYPYEMQRTLHVIRQHDLVGAMISRAMEKGEFDNLEGIGKPIIISEDPFVPEEVRMLYKILKDNGYAPHWIELSKEIDVLKARLNKEIEYFKKYTRIVYREKHGRGAMRRYEWKKAKTCGEFHEQLEAISKKILDYNLNCPVLKLTRANIDVDEEMKRIMEDIESLQID